LAARTRGPMSPGTWSDRFIAVPENRSALTAIQELADPICRSDSRLLVVHGPSGTGKTHLMQLLLEFLHDTPSRLVSAREGFEVPVANKAPRKPPERGKVRASSKEDEGLETVPLLVVEDVQFLPARAVERLVEVLDRREGAGLTTVVTASSGPAQVRLRDEPVPARLRTRLASGLVVHLAPLAPASRRLFLEELARRRGIEVPEEILSWLADEVRGIRALESALAQIEVMARIQGGLPAPKLILEHLRTQVDAQRPSVDRITGHVAGHFRVPAKELRRPGRQRSVLVPRQVSMYLARKLTPLSLQKIGAYFGGCDHSTVLYACRKVEQALKDDAALGGTIRQLHDELF
jgi:chromosomal replication initiator protein